MSEPVQDSAIAARWLAPDVTRSDTLRSPGLMTADKLAALQQQAYGEAYASGLEQGRQAGQEQLATHVEKLDELMDLLNAPLRQVDDDVEAALVDLSIRVARQIIRRELQLDPSHIVGVVREAVKVLPISSRQVTVHLHADDAAMVNAAYAKSGTEMSWCLEEDPALSHGDVCVTSETSQVDARVESRLDALLASLVGGERQLDE